MSKISGYAVYAFDCLVARLDKRPPHSLVECLAAVPDFQKFEGDSPLFVTWNTVESSRGQESVNLRGCIGTFEPQDLEEGIESYALIAALRDTRFNPIKRRELPSLECGVTVLSDFEPVDDPLDWEVGLHGVKANFTSKYSRTNATFLPDVAEEFGWDQKETLRHLADKAQAPYDADIKLTRYKGIKSAVRYEEYLRIIESIQGINGE